MTVTRPDGDGGGCCDATTATAKGSAAGAATANGDSVDGGDVSLPASRKCEPGKPRRTELYGPDHLLQLQEHQPGTFSPGEESSFSSSWSPRSLAAHE